MKNITMITTLKKVITSSILGIIISISSLSAQSVQDTIIANFDILEKIPQEKLYLHIDKPFYAAGEKIWFKGYLLNAVNHKDNTPSNFIITELINRSDSIVERKKIRRDSLGFENAFTLPATIPAGDYYLKGYSNWMLNQETDFFFYRNIKIGNAIDNTILSSIEYQQEDDTHYTGKVKFYGSGDQVYGNTVVRYKYIENGKVEDKGKKKSDENGQISIPLPDLKVVANRRIDVEFDDPQYIYKKTFYLPTLSKDFNVTFFPEGGALMAINHQNVAFKAQGADGYSREVEGFLFNNKGDTLTTFRSEHDGMGVISVNPIHGESYYAIVTSSDGVTKQFNLPTVESKGISLSVTHYKKEVRYEIQKTENTEWPEKLTLLVHTRGKLSVLQPINSEKSFGKISDSLFHAGITHMMLIDERGNALSERLIFIPDHTPHQWQIKTDKARYDKREKVKLQISAKDYKGMPVSGSFSVSITDHKSIQQDSLADNILTNILLTSDLKGHIENPGYYFKEQDNRTLRAIDFLMLTHGWRRHKLKNVLQVPLLDFDNYIEQGQVISGRIKGLFGNNIKKGPIFMLAPKHNIVHSTETNEKGEFMVNTSYPDSTSFVIQARTKKGFAVVDIEVDKIKYADVFNKTPFNDQETASAMDDYLIYARDQYYTEGGMRVYNLKEVVVTAQKKKPSEKSFYTGGINTYTLEEDRLERYSTNTVLNMVNTLPGVIVKGGNEIYIRNSTEQALLIIDDVIYEGANDMLQDILVGDISSLSVLRGTDAFILGPRGNAGAIVVTLKDPRNMPVKPARGVITYNPLGYSDQVEFYHPVYDTPEKKNSKKLDLRTTIYWNPKLELDAEGKVTIEYYTPDNISSEDIIIEGVDRNGKVFRFTQTINQL